ncbi:60S acidic ribosomal protein P2B [Platanthera zijinensis]|uniref:60S acidic ribosomal protein P2B n=1 Tax=Platanthera zijinensis TaxID=2320716 RepID=A0AAP0BTQ3_9ASPA
MGSMGPCDECARRVYTCHLGSSSCISVTEYLPPRTPPLQQAPPLRQAATFHPPPPLSSLPLLSSYPPEFHPVMWASSRPIVPSDHRPTAFPLPRQSMTTRKPRFQPWKYRSGNQKTICRLPEHPISVPCACPELTKTAVQSSDPSVSPYLEYHHISVLQSSLSRGAPFLHGDCAPAALHFSYEDRWMKLIAAYLLAVLGGNSNPSAGDIKSILESGHGLQSVRLARRQVGSNIGRDNLNPLPVPTLIAMSFCCRHECVKYHASEVNPSDRFGSLDVNIATTASSM